ncbi:hypothetical protein [Nitrosopumilus adriaticus]|uniref:Uncharacterized protein n=1 Tax=Nitrosopumilus adriaticus TaxID=1580092 RepID=A0A0D5C381_9ARCH|nr:hypothetical protein [Nitrosopumilus adriaticus]AJW70842.1 hypothetical protein NADRNF5_1154 [Nitrosopumilus adriaticus]
MNLVGKFKNKLRCTCNDVVSFELIDEIECDWGSHVVIQCPNCQDLFCIDNLCPAFGDVSKLANINTGLYSKDELENYLSNSHPN